MNERLEDALGILAQEIENEINAGNYEVISDNFVGVEDAYLTVNYDKTRVVYNFKNPILAKKLLDAQRGFIREKLLKEMQHSIHEYNEFINENYKEEEL